MTIDIIDQDGTNASASLLLDTDHDVEGERDAEGFLDNCEVCGFATGWVQPTTLGEDHWGHATLCTSDEVRAWIAKRLTPSCDGARGCTEAVTHIDQDGFAYCTEHGLWRRQYQPCRKLRPWELRRLQRGEQLARY